jgi:DEAD/DEAH box helicase domain-containing protein
VTSINSTDPEFILKLLEDSPFYSGQIVACATEQAKPPHLESIPVEIHALLRSQLEKHGIERLYTHQVETFEVSNKDFDCVVTTGTGSGKTLCYQIPALHRILQEPSARALFIYPTKALAQDQLAKMCAIVPAGIRVAAYDGDTPRNQRAAIRKEAHIILTNPDMLHIGILPNHSAWTKFLRSLRFIAIDEMHAYSGVFGSHVALVLRRLLRLCEWNGASPRIVSTSATIKNPVELFHALTGRQPIHIANDGAPRGKRCFAMWNPPMTDQDSRKSALYESALVFSALVLAGKRVIAFSGSRIATELVLNYAREMIDTESKELGRTVEAYRAGYTVEERRGIEKALFSGELRGISCTNAMELGIDVGGLDVAILNGFPGSISSVRQQAGRAGRGEESGLAIMVIRNDPLEQFLGEHPELILDGEAEQVRVRPNNPRVLHPHIKCAAFERPISPTDLSHFPEGSFEACEELESTGEIVRRAGMWFYPSHASPAADVDLRGADRTYVIEKAGEQMGTMEEWRAFQNAHPGAIYLHRGDQFIVRKLDIDALRIEVEATNADYFTQSLVETSVWPNLSISERAFGNGLGSLQGLTVTNVVVGFRRRSLISGALISELPLNMPPHTISTLGIRIDIPLTPTGDEQSWSEGVHALEHLLLSMSPIIAKCEPRDLGSAYYPFWPETGRPAIFVYDSAPGGSGISEALYEDLDRWIEVVVDRLESCRCGLGCPACILSPRCPYFNESLSKTSAICVARTLAR